MWRNRNMFNGLTALGGALLLVVILSSESFAEGKTSAYLFGDYAYVASSNDADLDGKSGFVVRRIYFTYDNDISEQFSARVRLEMNQKDFTSSRAKMEPVVKDAYLKWKLDRHSLYFGLSGTPTWGLVEKFWGYRWLEKTPLDLHKYGSSRDVGFAAKGALDSEKNINYHIMAGHGESNYSETDKGKKYYASVSFKPTSKTVFELYGDFEDSEGDESNTSSYIVQGFIGLEGDFGRAAAMFTYSKAETGEDSFDQNRILSGFVVAKLSEKANGVLRIDHLTNPNASADGVSYLPMYDNADNTTLVLAGVDFLMAKNVHFQPNIEMVTYGDDVTTGEKPDGEFIPRLSIYYKF